jgi:hypothetical protein
MDRSPEEIFDWDDPETYQWVICGSQESVLHFVLDVAAIALGVPLMAYFLMIINCRLNHICMSCSRHR